ncbi:MAG: DUF1778 domain-containing protein [Capsulimonadaceae bacterium]
MTQVNRTARLEARIAPNSLAIVKHAAELQGRSVSDFVVAAAEEAARRTIEETHIIQLSMDDQRRFAELLIDPPALSPAMERAREAHTRLIRKSTNARVPG